VACGGHKWLNSPFGAGFLYIRSDVQERLHPPIAGYMSLEPPAGGWENYFQSPSTTPNAEYRFVNEARRFETGGTANYPGAIGLAASVGLINRIGMDRIFAHVMDLTDYLIGNLRERSVRIVTPAGRENRSGIVTFSVGTAQEDIRLMQHLLERKVLVSVRYTSQVGGIRVSCHFFNSRDDIDALLHNIVP
jgi:cysteine desulfurase / selenocysteine lyase